MSSHPQLLATERRLVRLFVVGIFLFLIVFEAIFLASRNILEDRNEYGRFVDESDRMTRVIQGDPTLQPGAGIRRPGNIGFLIISNSGQVLRSRIAGQDVKNVSDILESTDIDDIGSGSVSQIHNFLIRKVTAETGETILFLAPKGYDNDAFMRDILRFLLMDFIILVPFYFMARVYVRETLEPVRENLDTMNHFVHDAGHELKTPLAIISGNLQLLRDSDKPDRVLINESLAGIDGMNDSIEGLLELADLKMPDKKNKVTLKPLIDREIEKISSNYSSITVQNTVGEKAFVYASEKHLSIVLRNLLENAMKYNKTGGSVTVSFEKNTLIVADTGIGIAPEEKDRIFDRFYRANAGSGKSGSGIGLTLVDRIAKLYGWTIGVESELGEGTTLSVKM